MTGLRLRALARRSTVQDGQPPGAVAAGAEDPPVRARGVTVDRAGRIVLDAVDLDVPRGTCTALIGPNGSGKTTLVRVLAGQLPVQSGTVWLGGAPLSTLSRREIARRLAIMHQTLPPVPGLSARRLVEHARYARVGALGMLHAPGHDAAEHWLSVVGAEHLVDREVDSLSGGERQRVRLALALAQGADVLILDEPATHLDIRHQLEMLELISRLRHEQHLTVVMVLHELDHAARYADRLVALCAGRIAAVGPPAHVLDATLLARVFGVRGRILRDEVTGRLHCIPDAPVDPTSTY